ncbi:MAG: hypothetical protein C0425_04395 [Chlorobiaceae bacterium]|nr:hypothetical protein [Chlorobiaceae bacterium]MBA4309557.1 hypothetical protein [Chlorobiaceae bacterium]
MRYNFLFLIAFAIVNFSSAEIFAQEENSDTVEVYLIDSFVPPENPNKFILSFFTSKPVKSKLLLKGKSFSVSENFSENHKAEIDISKIKFDSPNVYFYVEVENETGKNFISEKFDFLIPSELIFTSDKNYFVNCLFGGLFFLTPSFGYAIVDDKNNFMITKELSLFSYHLKGFNYPTGYLALEFSHIPKATIKNYLRLGYKHIFEIPAIEFVSPGLNYTTNLLGYNGVSPELTFGLFRFYEMFTVYARGRYNYKVGDISSEFTEFSVGLYSSFFTLHF